MMLVVPKVIALSTGFCTAALVTLHYKFGLRLRHTALNSIGDATTTNAESATTSSHLPSKFSILSQNTWLSFAAGGPNRRQRIQCLLNHIRKDQPDIICLQEMFLFALGPFILYGDFEYLHNELVHHLGYHHHSNPVETLPNFCGGNSGLMVYSKYPLESCVSCPFDSKIRRSFSAKGWMCATFKLSESTNLSVINTHLEHRKRDYKLNQLQVIDQRLQCTEDDTMRVCLGDFNICSNDTFESKYRAEDRLYHILEDLMTANGLEFDLYKGIERTFRETAEEPTAAYDHVFVNQTVRDAVVSAEIMDYRDVDNDVVASDHYGLLVTVDRNPSTS